MMLADPGLVVAKLVEKLDEFEVALEQERRILVVGMERRQEDAGAQAVAGDHEDMNFLLLVIL
jgi:hypothetical protein